MSSEIPAQTLNQRLALQRAVEVDDGAGGFSRSWQDLGFFWAGVEALSLGFERKAERDRAVVRYEVQVRRGLDVRLGDRFLWGSRILNIRGIRPQDKAGRGLLVDCEEESQ